MTKSKLGLPLRTHTKDKQKMIPFLYFEHKMTHQFVGGKQRLIKEKRATLCSWDFFALQIFNSVTNKESFYNASLESKVLPFALKNTL